MNEKRKTDLIEQILPWWKSNNYNPMTLNKKTLEQLLAIRNKMLSEAFKPKLKQEDETPLYRQIYKFNPLEDDGYGFEEDDYL